MFIVSDTEQDAALESTSKEETIRVCPLQLKFRRTLDTTNKDLTKIGIAAVEKIIDDLDDRDKKVLMVYLEYVMPKSHEELIVILTFGTTALFEKEEIREKVNSKYCRKSSEPLRVEL